MTTTIPTAHPDYHPGSYMTLEEYRPGIVNVAVSCSRGLTIDAGINVTRAALIDAVRALGVTVIDEAAFPPVEAYNEDADLCGIGTFSKSSDPEALEREGARYFAYAAHLRANPPVDEAQVDPLVAGIAEVFGVDPANISNAEQRTVGNRRVLRWTERMVTNGNVTWATRAAGTAGRVEFGGDTGLSISEALKAATEEAESLARQMVAPGEVQP